MRAHGGAINLMDALTRNIERVAAIRERYRIHIGEARVNVAPAIHLMTEALETAHRAAASGNIPDIARSLRDLEGFEV
jgi:hypothetical protein